MDGNTPRTTAPETCTPTEEARTAKMKAMDKWESFPLAEGWHWLVRRNDDAPRLAYFNRCGWRVADAIGRTTYRRSQQVERLYRYLKPARPPRKREPRK